jgi:hypothetical protein
MLRSKKLFLFIIGFMVQTAVLFAQQETTLQFLTWVPQAGYTDLTIKPDQYKTAISIPIIGSVQGYYYNSAFKYTSLVNGNTVDPNNVIPKLKDKNQVYSGGSFDLLSVRFQKKEIYFQISLREIWTQRFVYTNDLANLVWNGNASYAGQTADLSGVRVAGNYYRELGISATKSMNDKFIVGVRAKLLMGMTNVTTQQSESTLYTAPDGSSISGHSDFTLLTSGLVNDKDIKTNDMLGFNNLGAAIDFGGRYKYSEKLSFACNVKNLGFIHWSKDVKNYKVNGDYTYTGYLMRDSTDIANADWNNILDTLESVFKPNEDSNPYNSWLSPTIYFSGNYILKENIGLYSSLALDIYHGVLPVLTVGATHTLGSTLQTTINYTIMPNSYFNIGGGLAVRAGGIQVYMACDNIIAVFDPYDVKYFNARLGVNILLGKPETKE